MVIRCLLVLSFGLFTGHLWAKSTDPFISLELESDTSFVDGSVILNVSSTGLFDELSLSALNSLPMKRRETIGTHLRVHQGKLVEFATRRIELMPQQAGIYTIGPLTSGSIESNILTLTVLEVVPEVWKMPDELLQLEAHVTPTDGFSQQMLTYEASLKHRYPLASHQFKLPDFKGFRVYPVHEEQRTWENKGEGWRTIHWKYLLFAERSGVHTIAPLSLSGEMIKSSWQRAEFQRQTPSIELQIAPPAMGKTWWLPAANVEIQESWSQEPPRLNLGQSIQRRLHITAKGASAQQIPELALPTTRGLDIRLLSQEREESIQEGVIYSSVTLEYDVRPTSATPIFMDTVRLPWWNTETQTAKTALLPARRLDVALPEREDLVDAYLKSLNWKQRLETRLSVTLPSTTWLLLALAALASALYLVGHRLLPLPPLTLRHRAEQKQLRQALHRHDLNAALAWLNDAHHSERLNDEGKELSQLLNQRAVSTTNIDEDQWQAWRVRANKPLLTPTPTDDLNGLPPL